jgi:general secretion pathway protein G
VYADGNIVKGVFLMFSKRKGFTLVELLIVIIVIGILAGGMMLASGSASDSARASTLISELRNAKAAGVFWLANNISSTDAELLTEWTAGNMPTVFEEYMDNPMKAQELLFVSATSPQGDMFLIGKESEPRVLQKAIGQGRGILMNDAGDIAIDPSDFNGDEAYMRVR